MNEALSENTKQNRYHNLYKAFTLLTGAVCIGLLLLNLQQSLVISRLSEERAVDSQAIRAIGETNSQLVDKLDKLTTDNRNLTLEFRRMREFRFNPKLEP